MITERIVSAGRIAAEAQLWDEIAGIALGRADEIRFSSLEDDDIEGMFQFSVIDVTVDGETQTYLSRTYEGVNALSFDDSDLVTEIVNNIEPGVVHDCWFSVWTPENRPSPEPVRLDQPFAELVLRAAEVIKQQRLYDVICSLFPEEVSKVSVTVRDYGGKVGIEAVKYVKVGRFFISDAGDPDWAFRLAAAAFFRADMEPQAIFWKRGKRPVHGDNWDTIQDLLRAVGVEIEE